jgi:hypothetical protein
MPPGSIAMQMPVTAGAVQPVDPSAYQPNPQQWPQHTYETLEPVSVPQNFQQYTSAPAQSLIVSQENNAYVQIDNGSFQAVNEQTATAFEISSESGNSANYTDNATDSEISRQSNTPPSTKSEETVDAKAPIDLLDRSGRRPSGMNSGNRRKAPPSHLKLNLNNRSASYSATAPGSPGGPADMRRAYSSANCYRIQKPRCASGQRSPIKIPLTAQHLALSQAQYGNCLLPQTPLSPYIMSSTADRFPEVPSSASSEFGKAGWSSCLPMTSSMPLELHPSLSSPPITPHSAALASMQGPNATYWTPPQSAPATQTAFRTSNTSHPLLTPTFEHMTDPNMDRRPSLPINNFMVSNDGLMDMTATTVSDFTNLTPPTSNGNVMIPEIVSGSTESVADQIPASSSDFLQNLNQVSAGNLCNPIPVSSGNMLNMMTSGSVDFVSEVAPVSGLVNHLEAMASSLPADGSMMAPVFTNGNPFQQSSSMSNESALSSNYPSPMQQTQVNGAPVAEFIQYKPNGNTNQATQAQRAQNGGNGFQWNNSTSSDFNGLPQHQ